MKRGSFVEGDGDENALVAMVFNALINFRRFDETFSVPMDLYSGSPLYETYSMLLRENISKSIRRQPRSKTSLMASLLAKRPLIALL